MAIRLEHWRGRTIDPASAASVPIPAALGGGFLSFGQRIEIRGTRQQVLDAFGGALPGELRDFDVADAATDRFLTGKARVDLTARTRTSANLPAYTRTVNRLQANANGALGAQNGVALAVGDVLLVFLGPAGQASHADIGPYRVVQLGDAGTPWIFDRVPEFDSSVEVQPGYAIRVLEGTVGADRLCSLITDAPITLNTTAIQFAEMVGSVPPERMLTATAPIGGGGDLSADRAFRLLGSVADRILFTTGLDAWAEAPLTAYARTLIDDATAGAARTTLGLVIGTDVQAQDATLQSLAALGTVADRVAYTTGVDTWAETPLTAFGRSLIDDASAAAARTTLGLVIGTDVQAFDATLNSLAALGTVADRVAYTTGVDTWAETPLTAAGRALIDDASAAAQRTTLGLVIGTDVQAFDATLTSLAALGTVADRVAYTTGVDTWAETPLTAFGRSLIDDASAAAARTTLGLVIGTDVQAFDATLNSIAALGTAADRIAYTTAIDTWAEATLTAFGRSLIDDATAGAARTTLGLVIGTDVQAFDATLNSIAALGTVADRIAYTTGVDTWAETPLTAAGRALIDDASAAAQRATLSLTARIPDLTAAAEVGNAIDVTINIEDADGTAVSAVTRCICRVYDAAMLQALTAAFTLVEVGAGTEVSTSARASLLIDTDANGDAQVRVTDTSGAFSGTVYLEVTPVVTMPGGTNFIGRSSIIALVFA